MTTISQKSFHYYKNLLKEKNNNNNATMHNERHHVVTWRSPLNTLSYNNYVFMQHNSTVTNDVLIIGLQINCIYVMINAISSWLWLF